VANNRLIGSLLLFLFCGTIHGCGCGTSSDSGSAGPLPGATSWASRYRWPTSSNLRAVRANGINSLIVAGEASTILRSDDGGQSWFQLEHLPHSRGGDIVSMDFAGLYVEAVGSDSATPAKARSWTAINGVLDFTTVNANATAIPNLTAYSAVDVVSSTTSYRLTTDGVVEEVVNGVATPLPFNLPAGTWTSIDFMLTTPAVGIACGDNYKIYMTTRPAMGTWSAWAPVTSVPGAPQYQLRKIQFASTSVAYACGDHLSLLKSIDGGQNWLLQFPDPADPVPTAALHSLHFPVDALHGWAVGDGGTIFYTPDGGGTLALPTWVVQFYPSTGSLTYEDLYDVHFANNSVGYIVGNNGLVFRTSNGSNNSGWVRVPSAWTLFPDPLRQFNAVDFTNDGQIGLVAGNGGTLVRTLDGGQTWVGQNVPLPLEDYTAVAIPRVGSGNVAYACGTNGRILRTANLKVTPATWTAQTVGASTWRAILFPTGDATPTNVGAGYVCGDGATLRRTNDGTTWLLPTTPPPAPATNWNALSSNLNGLSVWVAGNEGKLSLSNDLGVNWATQTQPVLNTENILSFKTPPGGGTLFAGTTDGNVWRDLLGTGIWFSTTPPIGDAEAMSFADTSNGWIVTTAAPPAGGVCFTPDGGTNWNQLYVHTKNKLRAIWMSPTVPGLGYVVGDNGTILRTLIGGQ